jgi:hypothetical protein
VLWALGTSLLHSGIVINKKEYAFGGHDRKGMTGVYWTRPKSVPPGGTFKCEILQGFTIASSDEIEKIIKDASDEFHGTNYNLLTKNCNHFTDYLCQKLTGRPGPSWLNRAASVGIALPCVVPKEWIAPPEFDTADGELLNDEEDDIDTSNERSRMLRQSSRDRGLRDMERMNSHLMTDDDEWDSEEEAAGSGKGKGKGKAPVRDTSGRVVPPADRAPAPHHR